MTLSLLAIPVIGSAASLASAAIDSPIAQLANWGLAGAVIAIVLWRDHHREQRMARALGEQQKQLIDLLSRTTAALERIDRHMAQQHPTMRIGT
jgi:2-keto-3-deoxy-6-phosphogluconate aldolase